MDRRWCPSQEKYLRKRWRWRTGSNAFISIPPHEAYCPTHSCRSPARPLVWVRERGIMPLEEAIRKLTFVPASLFGIYDRGLVRPGMAADLMVFDPEPIAPLEPGEAQDLPGGAKRRKQLAQGIEYTVVNGEVLLEKGKHTGAYPGKVARNLSPA